MNEQRDRSKERIKLCDSDKLTTGNSIIHLTLNH